MEVVGGNVLWKWWLGVGGASVVLYMAFPGTAVADGVYVVIAVSVPAAILVGVRRYRPTPLREAPGHPSDGQGRSTARSG